MHIVRAVRRDARAHRSDYALAGVMVMAAIVVLATGIDAGKLDARPNTADLAGWFATIGICCSLVGRRRWPLQSVAVAVALLFVLGITDNSDSVGYLALLIALYSTASVLPMRRALGAILMVVLLVVAGRVAFDANPSTGLVGAGAAFALGRLIRRRRATQEDEMVDAERRAAATIEIAELDAAADRQRMARELHDVVAHSLSVIAVQAGIGAHLIDRQPIEAARALDAIRATSDAAGDELSRLIDLLRDGDSADSEPSPSLTDVHSLCAQVTEAGVPIVLVVDGDLSAMPAGVSLAAYRIVQEALTNVVRHAGPATATVTMRVASGHVEITVVDDGSGAPAPAEPERLGVGHGLVGMSERAQMYGGDAVAGAQPGGGFRVGAILQYFADAAPVRDLAGLAPSALAEPLRTRTAISTIAWDMGLALAFVALAVRELILGSGSGSSDVAQFTRTDTSAWILEIGCCLALAGRRRFPASSLLAASVLGVGLTIGDYNTGVIVGVFVVALYAVGSYATTARLIAALVGIVVAMGIVAWSEPPDLDAAGAVWTAMISAGAAATGFVVRRDRERRDAQIADHEEAGVAESRRARLAATTERLRIAEELNHVITRSMQSISTSANSGSRIVESDPPAALALLESISTVSRDALGDLRRLLKRMHADAEPAPHAPVLTPTTPSTPAGAR